MIYVILLTIVLNHGGAELSAVAMPDENPFHKTQALCERARITMARSLPVNIKNSRCVGIDKASMEGMTR